MDNTPTVIKTFESFEKINEFSAAKLFLTPSFDPKGEFLAFPKGKTIHVVDTSTWETKFKLENEEITANYSVCSISNCGTFLAAGSVSGEISVWNFVDKSKLKGPYAGEDTHPITSIAWNPKNNGEFAFTDADGQLSTIVTGRRKASHGFIADEAEEEVDNDEVADDLYDGIDFRDEDNENCVSLEKLKNETLGIGDDSDDEDAKTVKSLPTSVAPSDRLPMVKPFKTQPPFQPGSTPSHLEHRFMVK